MIGATSLVKVTPAASFLFTIPPAAASRVMNRIASKRFISSSDSMRLASHVINFLRDERKQKEQKGQKKQKNSFCCFCPSCLFCFSYDSLKTRPQRAYGDSPV